MRTQTICWTWRCISGKGSRNVWVIATLPKKEERQQLADRLKADLIHIDTPQKECLERVENDPDRHDKQIAKAIVEEYFEKFQP